MRKGAFTFVLHTHLPYCRKAGRWPHGEEWLHEAASETYLPLLDALHRLKSEGRRFRLTIDITPVLLDQLADPLVLRHLAIFLEDKVERAVKDLARFQAGGESQLALVASFYLERYRSLLRSFEGSYGGDIVGAFRRLQDDGFVEIAAGAATHPYLPLLERDSSIHAQLKVGVDTYRRHFGRQPKSLWLPECGYRPGYYARQQGLSYVKPGLEEFLAQLGIACFFCETHTLEGGEPVGKARGEAIGPYGDIPKRYVVPLEGYREPTHKTTYLPYWVQKAEVAVLGRNNRTGLQVWSAAHGYPGDCLYREFHKKDGVSGLQYWRVTDTRMDLALKEVYQPERAAQRVAEHSAHFAGLAEELLADFHDRNGQFGIIAAAYDTELLGHWWFEGVDWLEQVLRRLSNSDVVELTTATEYITKHPPEDVLALKEGSWGQAGTHFTWQNVDTEWMWPLIHEAEITMEGLVQSCPDAGGPLRDVLDQAARELLLLQSSDWPFLITTGQAREYATGRFLEHLGRFNRLAAIARSGAEGENAARYCQELFELDNVFPDIDYRVFENREQGSKGE